MSKNIYEDLAVIDKKIGEILNKMPASSFDKVDIKRELPIFSFLPNKEYETLKDKILTLRYAILEMYLKGDAPLRKVLIAKLTEYENFSMVFLPNKDFLAQVEDKKKYVFNILMAISIQNLNDDIRELIIYVNELRRLSILNNINFDSLLNDIIPLSSSTPTLYSISMREFFENVLLKLPNPIRAKEDH
ncbi:hypothetical protein [Pedobacter roseus]|uniref:Uncharacterized protein n=1 Tax=Pedobacter roseus TaxID=336820 RepID=A0A7G9QF52_9SPHI|nr:hypothetical protein [Pedobacter roseus]QNN41977.1 hypothetical protein H9L23_23250 [Pedobacter roseus]